MKIFYMIYILFFFNNVEAIEEKIFYNSKFKITKMRIGPSKDFALKYIYYGKNIPFEVIYEIKEWINVRDVYGDTGWIRKDKLYNNKYVFIINEEKSIGYTDIKGINIGYHIEQYALLKLENCQDELCMMSYKKNKIWVYKKDIWGYSY